jgi:methionyl-tRNA formyltransferase
MKNKRIVLLAGRGASTNIVFNAVNKNFGVVAAIIEDNEGIKKFLKRRIKKLGIFTVFGQILFQLFIAKPQKLISKKRINQICSDNLLDLSYIPAEKINSVVSVNSLNTIALLVKLNPDIIIVNGTRIISKKVLSAIDRKFINIHAGITPKYRGVHGTYWALVNNDLENSGVTVHYVDEGIDTGNILFQRRVIPNREDNFSTYPFLQLAEGLKILDLAIQDFFDGKLVSKKENKSESILWYHPTIWKYLYYRIIRGIK